MRKAVVYGVVVVLRGGELDIVVRSRRLVLHVCSCWDLNK